MLPAAGTLSPWLSPRMRVSTSADQTKSTAVSAKTAPMLVMATSTPPSAGPTKKAALSIVVDAVFAAVSSAGERASAGRSAACAGANAVPASAAQTAST